MRHAAIGLMLLTCASILASSAKNAGGGRAQATHQSSIRWVEIRGGTFDMGDVLGEGFPDELPVHRVTVSDFRLGATEVTVAQYRTFCAATGRSLPAAPPWGWIDDHPVVRVPWDDAASFCGWAGGRLPTEAEWEFAARERGRRVRFGNGHALASADEINFDATANLAVSYSVPGRFRQQTTPVASFNPNGLGLYDMSGNAREWCSDWYGPYSVGAETDPRGPATGSVHVLRGGSWYYPPRSIRCTYRFGRRPIPFYEPDFGFRCAAALIKEAKDAPSRGS